MVTERRRWRPRLGPPSLRVQLALGSALIALGAVLLVTIAAVVVSNVTFNDYRRTQLSSYAGQVAQVLGRQQEALAAGALPTGPSSFTPGATPESLAQDRFGALNVWVAGATGQILAAPTSEPDDADQLRSDAAVVQPALARALHGQPQEGLLGGGGLLWQTQRYYAAVPIRAGGKADGAIVGALAVSTLPRVDRNGSFAARVATVVPLAALLAAALAALVAVPFSRRLTRPVSRLTAASARMAAGDYAARVRVRAPEELAQLGKAFNEMAAGLESDVNKLREQERLRRELVANVSHELATPLTAIQGFTEALLDGVVDDAAGREQTTQLIAREAARLRRLVDQLRQVALYEGGAQTLNRGPVALPSLVEGTMAVLTPEIERKRIAADARIPEGLPPVYADEDRLTEVLLNLLENALRHTPEGGGIAVEATREGALVRVVVADGGPGIRPEDRDRVFDRFFRSDSSRSSATGGTGLGLAIVRALVEAHGGTITAANAPQGGARFTFTLPLAGAGAISSEEAASGPGSHHVAATHKGRGPSDMDSD